MKLKNGWSKFHSITTGNPFVVNPSCVCAITFQDGGAGIHMNDCNSTSKDGLPACYTTNESFTDVVNELTGGINQ